MLYRFDRFELDGARFELRDGGARVAVEPQVLSLLLLLVGNSDRLVSKDELVETVWNGRIVSDTAISSRVKAARQALGDDGRRQQMIRTVHGRGFRFVGTLDTQPVRATIVLEPEQPQEPIPSRPSIAVLPLRIVGSAGPAEFLAEALPHELIAELSRLRWLFVIARGSTFRFHRDDADLRQVGAVLGARYCLGGALQAAGATMIVTLELSDTRDSGVIWSERYEVPLEAIQQLRPAIVASVVAALEIRLPAHEARSALSREVDQLDAWSTYHLALRHMFRFNKCDNQRSLDLLERAVALQPEFARAHAALSFAHFQNAFLGYRPDVRGEAGAARRSAERSLEIDDLDPSSNAAMGRALWLTGDLDASLGWLDRAIQLSPNYAQGIYARAWTRTLLGEGGSGQEDADAAMALSPIDPLHYAMLATRGLAHLVRGETTEAAAWSERAASAPGAHVHIAVIAALCSMMDGNRRRAAFWAQRARERDPSVGQADFFRSFPFRDPLLRGRMADLLTALGL